MAQPPRSGDATADVRGGSSDVAEPGGWGFAACVWVVMTLAALAFVACFGVNVPRWDDFDVVSPLIGDGAFTAGWLWEQCNEHRIALPKLILYEADRLAGNDVRAGMLLSVAVLAALAAALIGLSGRLKGGVRSSDAVFPLLLLHLGHATNLLWSIQFAFILPTVLGTALLIAIAGRAAWPGPAHALAVGGVLALLPLCGGTGLAYVPALAAWLLAAAWAEGRAGRPGAGARVALIALATLPGLAVTGLYFLGFRRTINPDWEGGIVAVVRTGVQFLCGGLGIPAGWAWPVSVAAMLGLIALALAVLGRAALRRPEERPRIVGLLAFLGAMASLAAAVGLGRGWAGDQAGFQDRYPMMATPLWCWLVLALRLYAPPALGRQVPNALFAAVCVLAWPNTQIGLEQGRKNVAEARALTHDLREGRPAFEIVRRHTPQLHPSQDELARLLPLLRRAGFGPFRDLRDNPPFHEERLPLEPAEVRLAQWKDHTAYVTGVDPQVTFALASPRFVAGIRIRYSHVNRQGGPARFQVTWSHPGEPGYPDTRRYANWFQPTGAGRETTVWIGEVIDRFRIQPDNQPCEFRIDEIVLLEPRSG